MRECTVCHELVPEHCMEHCGERTKPAEPYAPWDP